jgi:hypothetical protein
VRLPRSLRPFPMQLAPCPLRAHAKAAWNAAPPWSLLLPAVATVVPPWSLLCPRCSLSFSLPRAAYKGRRSLLDAKDPFPHCTAPALAGNSSRGGRIHWPPARGSPVPPPPCPAAPTVPLASPRAATTARYRALTATSPEQLTPRLPLPGRRRAARRSHLRPVQTLKSKPRAPLDPSPSFPGQVRRRARRNFTGAAPATVPRGYIANTEIFPGSSLQKVKSNS